jgi:hypothetical protein
MPFCHNLNAHSQMRLSLVSLSRNESRVTAMTTRHAKRTTWPRLSLDGRSRPQLVGERPINIDPLSALEIFHAYGLRIDSYFVIICPYHPI